MKNILLTILTIFFTICSCIAQDIITKKSNQEIRAKIIEVTDYYIRFEKIDTPNSPIYRISKSDVLIIRYANGAKITFNDEANNDSLSKSTINLYDRGRKDAAKYYKGYRAAGTGILLSSLLSPLIGIIPAVIVSSTKPNETNLNYPNVELMKKRDYYKGYTEKAKRIKQTKAWTNWGIAAGAYLALIVLAVTMSIQ
jgi:hypothetical protein